MNLSPGSRWYVLDRLDARPEAPSMDLLRAGLIGIRGQILALYGRVQFAVKVAFSHFVGLRGLEQELGQGFCGIAQVPAC